MATKKYKLNFEVTATKQNLEGILQMMVLHTVPNTMRDGPVEIKVLKENEEPFKLEDKYLDDISTFHRLIEGK